MNFEKLTNYLDGLKEQYGIPETEIIVTKDYETVYHHLTGFSDVECTVPASEKDGYYFYSASKVMTMTAVMREIEQGRIHLYDPVCKYLPEFEVMTVIDREYNAMVFPPQQPTMDEPRHYAAKQIRIIDLMAMMGGLTYDLSGEPVRKVIEESGGKMYAVVKGNVTDKLLIPEAKRAALKPYVGKTVILGIRPEHFLAGEYLTEDNGLTVKVDIRELLGAEYNLYVFVGENKVIIRMPSTQKLPDGESIKVPVYLDLMHFFDKETEKAIVH